MVPFINILKKSCTCFSIVLLGTHSVLADPLDNPVQDGSGVVWANHDSDDGVYKQISFQSLLGVGYRIEKSNDLVNWTNFAQFYGVGNTVTWNLFANPVSENQNGGGNQDPAEEDTRKSTTLVMNKADTGELVLGWTSLDTAEAVQYVLTGLSISDEWNTNPIVGHSTDNYHFTMILMTGYNGVIPQNNQLGALDTAMIADFSSSFATINQSVIDNASASQLAPPPLPPDPSSKVFFRLAVNAKLDSDFDGIPDVLEYQNGNSSSFSHDSDGDGASDGSEMDQGTDPNDPNDTPEQEALIVTGNAEVGVPVEQSRTFRFPAKSPHQLFIVGLHTEEYPNYTSGEACDGRQCPFNDRLTWNINPSIGSSSDGNLDVNSLHKEWEQSEDEGLSLLGYSPIYIADMQVIETSNDSETTVQTEAGATNVEDGALPSTVVVASLPIELRDINDHAVEGDDVTITPWNTAQNIANENIAWIDAHISAQNPAPRMPQLEFRIRNLPQGYRIDARMDIRYTRGNGARAGIVLLEDRVRVPADGSFQQVDGDTWQIWQSYQNERFFGGDGHIEYKIIRVRDNQEEVAPRRINFRIGGENPDDARCRTYIETRPNAGAGGNLWFAYAIAKSETLGLNRNNQHYNQFGELPRHAGNVASPVANIPREQIWHWQRNVDAGIVIVQDKSELAWDWMNKEENRPNTNRPHGQRPQARLDRGVDVAVPNRTVQGVLFSDNNAGNRNGPIEHAVTIKAYNSATAHYCSWGGNVTGWSFNNTNGGNFDYVDRVCRQVENNE